MTYRPFAARSRITASARQLRIKIVCMHAIRHCDDVGCDGLATCTSTITCITGHYAVPTKLHQKTLPGGR